MTLLGTLASRRRVSARRCRTVRGEALQCDKGCLAETATGTNGSTWYPPHAVVHDSRKHGWVLVPPLDRPRIQCPACGAARPADNAEPSDCRCGVTVVCAGTALIVWDTAMGPTAADIHRARRPSRWEPPAGQPRLSSRRIMAAWGWSLPATLIPFVLVMLTGGWVFFVLTLVSGAASCLLLMAGISRSMQELDQELGLSLRHTGRSPCPS